MFMLGVYSFVSSYLRIIRAIGGVVRSGLIYFIYSVFTTVVVRSAVTGPDSSRVLLPAHRSNMSQINMITHPVTLN